MSKSEAGPPETVASSLKKMMRQMNCRPLDAISYEVKSAPRKAALLAKSALAKGGTKAAADKQQNTTAFHIMFGVPTPAAGGMKGVAGKALAKGLMAKSAGAKKGGQPKSSVRKFVVLEAKEVDGKIVSVTETHSK
jgi:hypothetical protein